MLAIGRVRARGLPASTVLVLTIFAGLACRAEASNAGQLVLIAALVLGLGMAGVSLAAGARWPALYRREPV